MLSKIIIPFLLLAHLGPGEFTFELLDPVLFYLSHSKNSSKINVEQLSRASWTTTKMVRELEHDLRRRSNGKNWIHLVW